MDSASFPALSALAGAMVEIWTDPDRCNLMGRVGRRCAEERFDVRRMLARYEAVYREERGGKGCLDAGRWRASTAPASAESSTHWSDPACHGL